MTTMLDTVRSVTDDKHQKERVMTQYQNRVDWAEREVMTILDGYFSDEMLDHKFYDFEYAYYARAYMDSYASGGLYSKYLRKHVVTAKADYQTELKDFHALYLSKADGLVDGFRAYQYVGIGCGLCGIGLCEEQHNHSRFMIWVIAAPGRPYGLAFKANNYGKNRYSPEKAPVEIIDFPDCGAGELHGWVTNKVDLAFTAWYRNNSLKEDYYDFKGIV